MNEVSYCFLMVEWEIQSGINAYSFRYCIPKFVDNKITFCFGEITYLEILLQSLSVAALLKCNIYVANR